MLRRLPPKLDVRDGGLALIFVSFRQYSTSTCVHGGTLSRSIRVKATFPSVEET